MEGAEGEERERREGAEGAEGEERGAEGGSGGSGGRGEGAEGGSGGQGEGAEGAEGGSEKKMFGTSQLIEGTTPLQQVSRSRCRYQAVHAGTTPSFWAPRFLCKTSLARLMVNPKPYISQPNHTIGIYGSRSSACVGELPQSIYHRILPCCHV